MPMPTTIGDVIIKQVHKMQGKQERSFTCLSISCFIPCELPFDLGLFGGTVGVLNCWCERISTLYSSDWSKV